MLLERETSFYDDDGFVIRETWGRIKSVSGPAPRPRPPPPTAPAPAPPPATVPRGRVVFASIGLLALAAIGALLGLPDVVTGLLVGGGLAAGAFALLRDRL